MITIYYKIQPQIYIDVRVGPRGRFPPPPADAAAAASRGSFSISGRARPRRGSFRERRWLAGGFARAMIAGQCAWEARDS